MLVLASACAAPSGAGSATAGAAPSALVEADRSGPAVDPVGTSESGRAGSLDRLAPSTSLPIARGGKSGRQTVRGERGNFSAGAPVKYPDGLSVTVDRFAHGVEKGDGPGAFAGREYTAMTLTVRNRSKAPVDLNQVVVTTTYGWPERIAAPVYQDSLAGDFSGTVKPGGSVSATYLFAIPAAESGRVVTVIDFDKVHTAATFAGPVR